VAAYVEILIGVKSGGAVRAGTPDRIGFVVRNHAAITEYLASAHRRRGVFYADGFAGNRQSSFLRGALATPEFSEKNQRGCAFQDGFHPQSSFHLR
jgi:hypothetical protein